MPETILRPKTPPPTAREMLRLPIEERRALLAQQAAEALALYVADMALPEGERELTALLEMRDPVLEPQEYLKPHAG